MLISRNKALFVRPANNAETRMIVVGRSVSSRSRFPALRVAAYLGVSLVVSARPIQLTDVSFCMHGQNQPYTRPPTPHGTQEPASLPANTINKLFLGLNDRNVWSVASPLVRASSRSLLKTKSPSPDSPSDGGPCCLREPILRIDLRRSAECH